jgi:hypothetical protein
LNWPCVADDDRVPDAHDDGIALADVDVLNSANGGLRLRSLPLSPSPAVDPFAPADAASAWSATASALPIKNSATAVANSVRTRRLLLVTTTDRAMVENMQAPD